MQKAVLGALLLAPAGLALAQEQTTPFSQPEVRRAIPVERPSSSPTPNPAGAYENPAWMNRVQPSPTPAATPRQPGPEPGFTPYRPQGRIQVAPTPRQVPPSAPSTPAVKPEPPVAPAVSFDALPADPIPTPTPATTPRPEPPTPPAVPAEPAEAPGDIRLSPTTAMGDAAAAADLDRANSVFSRKMYDLAIPEYERFLISHPSAKGRDMALFRLAECHRMLDNEDAARAAYEKLLREFREGDFAGASAYRLGEYLYAEKKFDSAAMQFQLASSQSKSEEVRLSALFNLARSYDQLNKPEEATKIFTEVAGIDANNPYRDFARLSLAQADVTAGRKKEALEKFEKLAGSQAAAEIKAEAAIKAAALAAELGDKKKALALFDRVLELPDSGEWRATALVNSTRLNYEAGNYKKVISLSEKPPEGVPDEAKAEMLLLAGNAYRQTGNARAARAVYDRLLQIYPDSSPTLDARFFRLLSMNQLSDPNLLKEADEYLSLSTNPLKRAQITLIKAEGLIKQEKYAEAAPLYASLMKSELDDDLKSKAMFKYAWCEAKNDKPAEAAKIYTEYLAKNTEGPNFTAALVQRGLALQKAKDYEGALKDFNLLIEKHPKAPERELALLQKALIQGQQQDYKNMIVTFNELLTAYPKSPAAGQANFWIGWAAFEEKDYKTAIEKLEAARMLDPAQYGERAALRIILCYYYLEDRAGLLRTIADNKKVNVPVEITRWLGRTSFEQGNYEDAERFLLPVVNDPKAAEPEVLIELAEAQIRLGKNQAAAPIVAKYLETARDPRSRARGLLANGYIAVSGREYDLAQKNCDEALLLQPEGRLNAEGRILAGEIAFSAGKFDDAARAFMTVGVLYDDPLITPRALQRAADAYKKSGNLMEAEKALKELHQRFPDFQKKGTVAKESR